MKGVKNREFLDCSQLTTVNGGEGLEEIGKGAFYECSSLHEISNLATVRYVKEFIQLLLAADNCKWW